MRARATIKLRRIWWWLRECWPFSHLFEVIKALPLLVAWCVVAGALFYVFQWLLYFLSVPLTGDKETIALVSAFLAGLIGFGVQQWRQMAEAKEARQQEGRKTALQDIEQLGTLIRDNPPEAARRFRQWSKRTDGVWQEAEIKARLQEKWNDNAPPELQDLVVLFETPSRDLTTLVKRIGHRRVSYTLQQGWRYRDEEWQGQIRALLGHPELQRLNLLEALEGEPLKAILGLHPDLALWPPFHPRPGPEVEQGLRALDMPASPFGPGIAEKDTLLMSHGVDLPMHVMERLRAPEPVLLSGPSGSGKTGVALLSVRTSLLGRHSFPVYCRPAVGELPGWRLEDVARATARTLLRYLAVTPSAFLQREIEGKAAIAYLLARFVGAGADLVPHFQRAGLPSVGPGRQMLAELEPLTQSASASLSLGEGDLLMLLGEARPHGFSHMTIWLDVQVGEDQQGATCDDGLSVLLGLLTTLERRGVLVKAFLPAEVFKKPLRHLGKKAPVEPIPLEWSGDELRHLLVRRLARFGYDSLAAWCIPGETVPDADQRLVERANGSLRRLMELGNALLRRIGQRGNKLTAADLDQVLGVKR